MYTVQRHHPGTYGDQQHVFGMNIADHFSILHLHPALEKDVKHQSPNYWVGYGHFPHSVQDENVNLSITASRTKSHYGTGSAGLYPGVFPKLSL